MSFFDPMNYGPLSSAKSLPFPVSPMLGESIAETALRAAAENSYEKVGYVLSAAGISYQGNFSVAAKVQGHERELALTLGLPDEYVRKIIPYPVPGRPGWSDFFGVPMRVAHRTMKYRRLSPRSLGQALHLKAIWSVKILSFDPQTKEQLLEACPECRRRPTYLRTYGVQYCEFCNTVDDLGVQRGKVDFRDYPQPIVEVEDGAALQFVTDLIDPERQCKRTRPVDLHAELDNLGPGDLFEFIVAVACAATCPASWNAVYLDRPAKSEDYVRFTPEVLATAGRTVLNWPKGFDELAEVIRASAGARSGYYSVRKELAPLVALTQDPHLPEQLRVSIRSRIKQNTQCTAGIPTTLRGEYRPASDFIPVWDAAPRFSAGPKTILKLVKQGHVASVKDPDAKKSPVLINCRDLQTILELRRSTVEARSVAYQLGIPRPFLKHLVEVGNIEPVNRPDADRGSEYYSKNSIEELKRRCRAMARNDTIPAGAMRLGRAVGQLRLGSRTPWGGIVERLLSGEVQIWPVGTNVSISSYLIRSRDCLAAIPPSDHGFEEAAALSQGEAASFLGITVTRVNQLARAGLLSVSPTVQELKKFSERYVLTSEVMDTLALKGITFRKQDVLPVLRSYGIEPRASVNGSHGYVWKRTEIASVM